MKIGAIVFGDEQHYSNKKECHVASIRTGRYLIDSISVNRWCSEKASCTSIGGCLDMDYVNIGRLNECADG